MPSCCESSVHRFPRISLKGMPTRSAVQQSSIQSRQQIVNEVTSRPFFDSSSQGQRIATRGQRVTDMIFDSIAPHTPPEQREQFLALLKPFAIAGALFVIHSNMDPRWRVPSLWAAVVAFMIEVLWLRSSVPMTTGFSCGNAVILIDALGEQILVPDQFCHSPEVRSVFFHSSTLLMYSVIVISPIP